MMVQITISMDDAGAVQVKGGPFEDKLLCYALLEAARDAIRGHIEAQTAPRIQAPDPKDIPKLIQRVP